MAAYRNVCFLLVTLSLFIMITGETIAAAEEFSWQAGTARVDITPTEPIWLAGYAGRNRPAEGSIHPLYAKALVLRDAASNQSVLITCDILGFPKSLSERLCARIEKEHGFSRAHIILSAAHTHSAPVIDDSLQCMYTFDVAQAEKLKHYAESFENQLPVLVGEALADLKPAALFSENGVARFAVNRRNNIERDLTPTTDLKGPNDHAVPTLKVVAADGTLMAVVFGYACHATVLDGYAWCGDYPGFAQAALETAYPGTTAMFFAGCGADQNPLPRRSIARAKQYGNTLAEAVKQVLEDPMHPLEAHLTTAYTEIPLEMEPAPDLETLKARQALAAGYEQSCLQSLIDTIEQGDTLPTTYPYPVQVWRLGDQTLVALGGEVTVPYAIGLKERMGQNTFVMGYANDVMAYIPSETILQEGGYEGKTAQLIYGLPNSWKPGIENLILETVVKLAAPVAIP